MSFQRRLGACLVGVVSISVSLIASAGPYAYLSDANVQGNAPTAVGSTYPKIMSSGTKSVKLTAEQMSKYDFFNAKPNASKLVSSAQSINPNLKHNVEFPPRAYQGYTLKDPCIPGAGIPFNDTGSATENCKVYAGHWLYHAGTRLTSSISPTTKTLKVQDASRVSPGSYVVIYDAPAGSFKNAEHAKVANVNKGANTITLANRGYKSAAKSHPAQAIVAQHALGQGGGNPLNWSYNHGLNGPLDSKNRSTAEAMVQFLAINVGKDGAGRPSSVRVDGIYFDADEYFYRSSKVDIDNDLVPDGGFSSSGVNLWGEGMNRFYAKVAQRFPNLLVVGGYNTSRGFKELNGIQMEGFPVSLTGPMHANPPQYGHQKGNDGLDSKFQRYLIHTQFHKANRGYTENLSKTPTRTYPETHGVGQVGVSSNRALRLGLGLTLMGDGFFGHMNSDRYPDRWYDEYAVDTKPGSPTFGRAMASNKSNEANIRKNKGWLGKPLGAYKRLYDSASFAPNRSKISNGGFEGGTNGWTFENVATSLDGGTRAEGSKSLKIVRHNKFAKDAGGARLKGPGASVVKGKQYTLAFAVRAAKLREIVVQTQGARNAYLVPDKWVRIVHTFTATSSGQLRPYFNVGSENVPLWIDAVYLFEGNANVFLREFEKGVVAVNSTPTSRTVDLGGTFLRIKGTGQDPINNGAALSKVTIAPYDAAILVRRANEQRSAGRGGNSGGSASVGGGGNTAGGDISDGVADDSDGGSNSSANSCGAPTLKSTDASTLFAYKDTCQGKWMVRVLSKSGWKKFEGDITVAGSYSGLAGAKLESADSLVGSGKSIRFTLKTGTDSEGFDFKSGSGAICLSVKGSKPPTVRLGGSAKAVGTPVNLVTGGACGGGDTGGGDTGGGGSSLSPDGKPSYSNAKQPGTYLYRDKGTNRWHLRVHGGGVSKAQRFTGEAYKAEIKSLKKVSVEKGDSVTQPWKKKVKYGLTAKKSDTDGFDFTAAPGTCVKFSGKGFLGKSKTPISSPLNLSTLGSCN